MFYAHKDIVIYRCADWACLGQGIFFLSSELGVIDQFLDLSFIIDDHLNYLTSVRPEQ